MTWSHMGNMTSLESLMPQGDWIIKNTYNYAAEGFNFYIPKGGYHA